MTNVPTMVLDDDQLDLVVGAGNPFTACGKGAVAFGVGGAAGGAVTGSLFGGVGAGPGALAGGAGGAVSGCVGGALSALF